jgi:hypothetical protein
MSTNVVESSGYKPITGTGLVASHAVQLVGFLCVSSSALTVKIWDATSPAGAYVVNTMSVSAGDFVPVPAVLTNGCYITFGGSGEITLFFNPVQ